MKQKTKNKIGIILGIIILTVAYLGDDRNTLNYWSIQSYWRPYTVATVHNLNEKGYNPCGLDSVVCEGEPEPIITPAIESHTPENAVDIILKKYFGEKWWLARAVMMSEGKYDRVAFNPTNNSNDRGHFQISQKYHPEVSDECAFDSECNIKEAHRISKGGTDWHEWYGYTDGGFKNFL